MAACKIRDDQRKILIDLNITPDGCVGFGREEAEILRRVRNRDVYKGYTLLVRCKGVFTAILRIRPSPYIGAAGRAKRRERKVGCEVDLVAREAPRHPTYTVDNRL